MVKTFKLIESTKVDEGYIELKSGSYDELEDIYNARLAERKDRDIHGHIDRYEQVKRGNAWDMLYADEGGRDGRIGGVYQRKTERNTTRDNERSGADSKTKGEIRHSRRIIDSDGVLLTRTS